MMRVVLDTNSLLVNIGKRSQYRPIFDALLEGHIQLLISNEILNEYVEKLEEKANIVVAENISNFLLRSPDVERVDIYFNWSIITADVDDRNDGPQQVCRLCIEWEGRLPCDGR